MVEYYYGVCFIHKALNILQSHLCTSCHSWCLSGSRPIIDMSCIFFSSPQSSNSRKINDVNVFTSVFFVWKSIISVQQSRCILNLHLFNQWTYAFACNLINFGSRFTIHSNGTYFFLEELFVLRLFIHW